MTLQECSVLCKTIKIKDIQESLHSPQFPEIVERILQYLWMSRDRAALLYSPTIIFAMVMLNIHIPAILDILYLTVGAIRRWHCYQPTTDKPVVMFVRQKIERKSGPVFVWQKAQRSLLQMMPFSGWQSNYRICGEWIRSLSIC